MIAHARRRRRGGSLARGGSDRAVSVVHAWLHIVQSHCMTIFLRSFCTAARRVQTPAVPHSEHGPLILTILSLSDCAPLCAVRASPAHDGVGTLPRGETTGGSVVRASVA